ncbi:hypothetical protein [Archangium sp.]|uniref:hypothetical protein n=1 Tax=Archangium sp. TaxID=1872627 RepID=UPI002ED87F86
MKAAIYSLVAVASIFTSVSAKELRSLSADSSGPAVTCEPGSRGCNASEQRGEEPPNMSRDHHPCGWVETCQYPCEGEGNTCCHADWDCPLDANLPRC